MRRCANSTNEQDSPCFVSTQTTSIKFHLVRFFEFNRKLTVNSYRTTKVVKIYVNFPWKFYIFMTVYFARMIFLIRCIDRSFCFFSLHC